MVEEMLGNMIAETRRDFPGVPIIAETLPGSAGRTLAEAADTADLLVVGGHGQSRLRHSVLGSVSEACVRLATCPVMIIPSPQPEAARSAEGGPA